MVRNTDAPAFYEAYALFPKGYEKPVTSEFFCPPCRVQLYCGFSSFACYGLQDIPAVNLKITRIEGFFEFTDTDILSEKVGACFEVACAAIMRLEMIVTSPLVLYRRDDPDDRSAFSGH